MPTSINTITHTFWRQFSHIGKSFLFIFLIFFLPISSTTATFLFLAILLLGGHFGKKKKQRTSPLQLKQQCNQQSCEYETSHIFVYLCMYPPARMRLCVCGEK